MTINIPEQAQADRNAVKFQHDIKDLSKCLEISLQAAQTHREMTKVVAMLLRSICIENRSNKNAILLEDWFKHFNPSKDLLLHPIVDGGWGTVNGLTPVAGFSIESETGLNKHFNLNAGESQLLPIREWLDQDILPDISKIRNFIKDVADKEGAHADAEYSDLRHRLWYVGMGGQNMIDHHLKILGRYILSMIQGLEFGEIPQIARSAKPD